MRDDPYYEEIIQPQEQRFFEENRYEDDNYDEDA